MKQNIWIYTFLHYTCIYNIYHIISYHINSLEIEKSDHALVRHRVQGLGAHCDELIM